MDVSISFCLCIGFYDLSAWCCCWSVVYIRMSIYNEFPSDYKAFAVVGSLGSSKSFNHTS